MKCKHARRQLSAHLEGELAETPRRRVEAHLGRCAACRAEYAVLSQLPGLMQEWNATLDEERSLVMAGRFRETLASLPAESDNCTLREVWDCTTGARPWWRLRSGLLRPGWAGAVALTCLAVVVVAGLSRFRRAPGLPGTAPTAPRTVGASVRAEPMEVLPLTQAMRILETESDVRLVAAPPPASDVQLALRDLVLEAGAFETDATDSGT